MPNVESLLIEAGIAGVFAAFAIVMFREFIKYMAKRDEIIARLTETIRDLCSNVSSLTEVVEALRADVRGDRREKEKTKPRPKTLNAHN